MVGQLSACFSEKRARLVEATESRERSGFVGTQGGLPRSSRLLLLHPRE
jgi:hypothetical protein